MSLSFDDFCIFDALNKLCLLLTVCDYEAKFNE